ncbi:MAG: 4-alpha-glucanotransferase [Bacteroidales bacterium]|nr:4-alpha-glucanotransferase [Bacteroidales bacterium]
MKLNVNIEYRTSWGEELVLCIGGKRYPLSYCEGGLWTAEIARITLKKETEYSYEVIRDGQTVRSEWKKHLLVLPEGTATKVVEIKDRWNDRPADAPFYSTAFTKAIFGRNAGEAKAKKTSAEANVLLQVSAANVRPNEVLALAAGSEELGAWAKVIPFDGSQYPLWTLPLNVTEPFAYKIIIADKKTLAPLAWEEGENRWFAELPQKGTLSVVADIRTYFNGRNWKGAGTAIPVFSLRTEDDFGVGEFFDLKKMVDWAASTGQGILQLLPINDTTMFGTWEDSYPYNPNSTFALHPQYINLPAAGVKADEEYKALQAELNALEQIDYEKVNNTKIALLRKAFEKTFKKLSATAGYQAFVQKNQSWLIPYAAFCVLRDQNGTPDFSQWKGYAKYSRKKVAEFCAANQADIDFWCFVQYHLDRQLSEVCEYAHSKGVVFKGDLPIGISRTSVDAWLYPELFHMDSQAGAPPDAFSADGQNWGFPTYNWEKMAQDGYAWWKARLAKMSEYFDAFRIDHILGFFRIWEIPLGSKSGLDGYFNPALPFPAYELENQGFDVRDNGLFIEDPRKTGHYHPRIGARSSQSYQWLDAYRRAAFDRLYDDFFYHRNNEFWKEKAMQKLPALLDSTGMLACGEDLGMIPATVPQVMSDLRILSLEIQRMPKDPAQEFANPAWYPYLSVCTTSTHDMNPIRAWWEEDRKVTDSFYHTMLGGQGETPFYCEPWICRQIVEQHLWSPAMLTVLPLQDWLSMDGALRRSNPNEERINVPANSRHYWRYRMHLTVEQLQAADEFNATLSQMIADCGRK